jgi:hypothetical protein
MLSGGQVFEQVGALWKGFFLELQKTVDERFHDRFLMGAGFGPHGWCGPVST